MKTYNFMNHVHAQTDLVGHHKKTWVEVGMSSYATDKDQHIEGGGYFSFDEVKELYEKGLTSDNVFLNENEHPSLNTRHLSAITSFTIINGIAFTRDDFKYPKLIDYAKKVGYVFDTPQPVDMFAGVKTMTILDENTFLISYQIQPEKFGITMPNEIEQFKTSDIQSLVLGTMKRLNTRMKKLVGRDGHELTPVCSMEKIKFNKSILTLSIQINRKNIMKEEFIHTLKNLDLEIFHLYNTNYQWKDHLHALKQGARDYGQGHWINEDWDDSKNNYDWYDKNVPSLSYTRSPVKELIQQIQTYAGVKKTERLENQDVLCTYTIVPEKFTKDQERFTASNVDKLIQGTFKRLQDSLSELDRPVLLDWHYEKEQLVLQFVLSNDSNKHRIVEDVLTVLDLEIYYFWHHRIDWYNHLTALAQCARDKEQSQLINEENNGNSNIKFYDN